VRERWPHNPWPFGTASACRSGGENAHPCRRRGNVSSSDCTLFDSRRIGERSSRLHRGIRSSRGSTKPWSVARTRCPIAMLDNASGSTSGTNPPHLASAPIGTHSRLFKGEQVCGIGGSASPSPNWQWSHVRGAPDARQRSTRALPVAPPGRGPTPRPDSPMTSGPTKLPVIRENERRHANGRYSVCMGSTRTTAFKT
jgi:hypothetical protein